MSFIPRVAFHNSGGDIVQIVMDTGDYPDDGTVVDGRTVHRIFSMEDLTEAEFINQRIWASDQWTTVTSKPNKFAYWDTSLSTPGWNWDTDLVLAEVRAERNIRLANSDWAVIEDSPLTDTQKTEARTYRTTLRNLPSTLDLTIVMGKSDVTWPIPPSFIA